MTATTPTSPLVSIVLPFWDAGRFLRETIESVRAQRYAHWELILVDDGSRDESVAIAREAVGGDPERVRYVQHPGGANRGISASRNAGIRLARGDFLALLDGDDVWLPDKLSDQVALLVAHPAVGMLYGETQYWYSWTGRPEDMGRDMYPDLGVAATSVVAPPEMWVRCLTERAAVPCPCSVVLRRDVVTRVGGFEEQFTGMFEDQAFYAKVMLREPVLVARKRWDRYRRHSDSVYSAAKRDGTVRIARLSFLAWLERYLTGTGNTDRAVWRAVRHATWATRHPRLASVVRRFQPLGP